MKGARRSWTTMPSTFSSGGGPVANCPGTTSRNGSPTSTGGTKSSGSRGADVGRARDCSTAPPSFVVGSGSGAGDGAGMSVPPGSSLVDGLPLVVVLVGCAWKVHVDAAPVAVVELIVC